MQWTSAGWQAGRLGNVDLAAYIVTMNAAETQTKRTIRMALSRGKVRGLAGADHQQPPSIHRRQLLAAAGILCLRVGLHHGP